MTQRMAALQVNGNGAGALHEYVNLEHV